MQMNHQQPTEKKPLWSPKTSPNPNHTALTALINKTVLDSWKAIIKKPRCLTSLVLRLPKLSVCLYSLADLSWLSCACPKRNHAEECNFSIAVFKL